MLIACNLVSNMFSKEKEREKERERRDKEREIERSKEFRIEGRNLVNAPYITVMGL